MRPRHACSYTKGLNQPRLNLFSWNIFNFEFYFRHRKSWHRVFWILKCHRWVGWESGVGGLCLILLHVNVTPHHRFDFYRFLAFGHNTQIVIPLHPFFFSRLFWSKVKSKSWYWFQLKLNQPTNREREKYSVSKSFHCMEMKSIEGRWRVAAALHDSYLSVL